MGMKEHALAYQKKGFSVIPISPSNKQPMIKFADKPALTAQEIEDFWTQYPDSNIAVRTDKFFVIDIDLHGKHNGYKSLANWEHLNLITPTLQARTASGGKHIFYFKHPDVTMTQMIGFLPGVDIKAHPNNYVLVAPSKTPKGEYAWDLEKSKDRKLNIVHIGDSHIQADVMPNVMRQRLQESFGNAGLGLVFPYSLVRTNGGRNVSFTSNIRINSDGALNIISAPLDLRESNQDMVSLLYWIRSCNALKSCM